MKYLYSCNKCGIEQQLDKPAITVQRCLVCHEPLRSGGVLKCVKCKNPIGYRDECWLKECPFKKEVK